MLVIQILFIEIPVYKCKIYKKYSFFKKYKNYTFLVKRIHSDISCFPLQIGVIKVSSVFSILFLRVI